MTRNQRLILMHGIMNRFAWILEDMKEADILSVRAAYNDAGRLQYLFAANRSTTT